MHIDVREALRYLGVRGEADAALAADMTALAREVETRYPPRWVWRCCQVAELALPGETAARMLADCTQAAVLVCTLGMAFEVRTRQEQARSMARAVMLDALGSAWVEAGCDAAALELANRFPGMFFTDRFSPGYGDLPLDVQPGLLDFTDAARRVGVNETESHLLTPQKSVTAIIGIAGKPQRARIRGCAFCAMRDACTLRKAGNTCV